MEKKICKKCGRELPLSEFKRNRLSPDGYLCTCNACSTRKLRETKRKTKDEFTPPHKIEGGNPDLAQFTPRELMDELKARGYRGKLSILRETIL